MNYIYNITYHIENSVFNQWKNWIFSHIEEVLKESFFNKAKLLKIDTEDNDSQTYSIQYETSVKENILHFQSLLEAKYRHLLFIQFGEKVLPFATKIEIVQEFNKLK